MADPVMRRTSENFAPRTIALALMAIGAQVCAADRPALPGGLQAGPMLSEASLPRGDDGIGLDAIEQRREALLLQCARQPLNLKARDPKHQHPAILALLALGEEDSASLEYLARGAAYRDRGSMFGMATLARILAAYEARLPEDVVAEIREQVTGFPRFLSGGTENHRAMQRVAGLIFGERWPEDTFHPGIMGRELAAVCKEYVRDYGRQVYAGSMHEYLSPVYHATNTAAWLTLADYAQDEEARLMARAILDWMMADLALNSHHDAIVPPMSRCKSQLHGVAGHDRETLGSTLSSAWLYWGSSGDRAAVPGAESASLPNHAQSDYVPPLAIRRLGAKQVALPYAVMQSRSSMGTFESLTANEFGYAARDERENGPPDLRYHLRSVYFDHDFALGAGYFSENIHDPSYRESIAFGAVWRSRNPHARLVVGHPYWFVNHTPASWAAPSPEDMWSGMSPFQQAVHWENAALVLFAIPELDPCRDTKLRWGPAFAKAQPLERPLKSGFAYYPETMDEIARTEAGFFLREGDVYVAIRPLREGARRAVCAVPGYARIDLPGDVTGCAVELGSRREFGSFEAFQTRIEAAPLDISALLTEKRVRYTSTRGHRLEMQFSDRGWRPKASVNGIALGFDRWPICESPYVTCRDRVLEVNDGRQGVSIDWRGAAPVYRHFELANGEPRPLEAK